MFELKAPYTPKGDQIKAIETLKNNMNRGIKEQILLGATGTGKTYTMANMIQQLQKKTLILAPNKTLAGQLYGELKAFFPNNRVEYFISYYDYYQPEAYVVSSDTYIEKDSSINDEIDEMRHAATSSLLDRDDVIVVASVSCIYGIGDPDDYKKAMLFVRSGDLYGRDHLINKLVELTYQRNDIDFHRGTFRVRGDSIEVIPAYERAQGIRISFFGDEVEEIKRFDVLTGQALETLTYITIFPATHFMTDKDKLQESIRRIKNELQEQIAYFKGENLLLEAQRIEQRTKYDIEMLEEIGMCSGIENYSRHLSLREAGETPATLVDFFGDDFLLIIDESHVTVPQVRGMYNGDRSRKMTLVNYGFRLPSALDNRPLKFEEFEAKMDKVIYLSATPGAYELEKGIPIVEQIIRPTYLLDPEIEIRSTKGQMDDLYFEIKKRVQANERVLVTTLTIRMSEDLTAYFKQLGMKVAYLHSEIKSLERITILRDLRLGKYDCLIGINLLREGLDLPEVSLVAILDADKQGFLRSERSLIQTIGRAARNLNGKVIMYADSISDAMTYAMKETERRRAMQLKFNVENNVTPVTIQKEIRDKISIKEDVIEEPKDYQKLTKKDREKMIKDFENEMKLAAKNLNFERAVELRDLIFELKAEE
ncbi:MAG: excinuclease ABC subunit B [Tenericutes bacterium GWC2_34_14]|nr:MAG: excinuclease ABC subunit B [Tenericutes bacterium GWC2_34_14]OHE33722.1 MAG: excinuclease ABC subunit B [Tenericutes bacterium GWE2_34_108]OHE37007.1 MAG: excinuclease ABC subunit B [Tenericutes bacterium GWF1_35_14]OHE37913.1 MAG: excinuclease ABC subunit B [Tenericutes bacterium GWF2_35_184]OHE41090.1 MAG: excinuclease ABC subunit B [Tenericutes bacterium RIFOXYA12_FULL_35_10]OHE43571.1 MAG: excinuclease ABC subunit B [Tenericutes bacterium RIFOXYA2_FULL_36_32]OHE46512.1 MAG: excinu